MASLVRIIGSPDKTKCFPISSMSLGRIFEKSKKKGSLLHKNSEAFEIILSPDSECLVSSQEDATNGCRNQERQLARRYFSQAYGYYQMGVNYKILKQVIEFVDSGLECNPTGDIKIALLFLKAIALYQSALELKEWLDRVSESPLKHTEAEGLIELHRDFTAVSAIITDMQIPDENQDLLHKIQELKERQWPTLN